MSWSNMLSPWQWALLGAIPAAIVLLYFLKLKRQPLEVPSTYLWRKSIEDLRVNSIWQRLRRSLLLFLQLLLVALAMLALARPNWKGSDLVGERFVFLIDNSASMGSTDVVPSRLSEAKRRVGDLIDQMKSGDVAMIISFADTARTVQGFTDSRRELRRRLDDIAPTDRPTSISQALSLASGLANTNRVTASGTDKAPPESLRATMYIFSDGKFPDVSGFSPGNLTPIYVPIGAADSKNLAITSFSAERPENKPDLLQLFARLENCGAADVTTTVSLHLGGDDTVVDQKEVVVKAHGSEGVVFDQPNIHEATYEARITEGGELAADDRAFATVNEPRHAKVLFVTPGDDSFEAALETGAEDLADVTTVRPDFLQSKEYQTNSAARAYDLVIFDQCAPKEMPQANTLFIGRSPPTGGWTVGDPVATPQVIDVNADHPLTQLIDLGNVRFVEGRFVKPPAGGVVLIDANHGALMAIAPREGFEDAVLGVEIEGNGDMGRYANTDWPLRFSFSVFAVNVLKYFSGANQESRQLSVTPGQPVDLRNVGDNAKAEVLTPDGKRITVDRGKLNTFHFSDSEMPGVYEVDAGGKIVWRFAVNLFDGAESNIPPRDQLVLGTADVKGQTTWTGARREAWKWLLLAALAVLVFEWYIYNRRVYL